MKKTLLTLLAAAFMLPAAAQYQIPNSDFESWGSDANEPGSGWYSFSSARTDDLSSFLRNIAKNQSKANTTKVTGRGNTGNAAKLISKNMLGAYANGNLTSGRINMGSTSPSNEKNYNFTERTSSNCCAFTGRPDSLVYWAKFKRGSVKSGTATHNGRCQAIIHGNINYQDPYETSANEAAYKVGIATVYATPCTDWTRFSGEFTYTGVTASTSYILASFTTNPTPGGSYDDEFIVDDIAFIYNSQLSSLMVNGATVSGFDRNVYNYTVNVPYTEGIVTATDNTAAGVATIETSYDANTAVYTIVVKGQNISADASNYHTYTIQFEKATTAAAELSQVTVGGVSVALTSGVYAYTLPFAYNPGIAVEAVAAEGGTLVEDNSLGYAEAGVYDNDAKTITVSVTNTAGDATDYVFSFTEAKATTTIGGQYDGALSIVLGASGSDNSTPLANTSITISENQDGTLNLQLKNFEFAMMDMLVGDIYVPALDFDGSNLTGTRNVRLYSEDPSAAGLYLGHLPVVINMSISDVANKIADAQIDIVTTESTIEMVTMFDKIHVDFVPFQVNENAEIEETGLAYKYQTITGNITKASTKYLEINNALTETPMSYIDMTGAEFANDVTAEDLKTGAPADNNTIYYVPASANFLAGTNVVVGNSTTEFALNDKVSVNIPTAFNALKVSYNRGFTAGNWSTFVTPVGVSTSDIDGTVYELTGCSADAFEFTEVTGNVVANKPYLVKLNGASLFTGTTAATVAAASQTEENMTVTAGRVTQVGSYQRQETTSDASKTWYGYTGGRFVKSNNGVINPFRTAFYVTGGSDARSFGLNIGDATGINQTVMNIEDAPAYDLQGRRVKNAQKGTFIIGGNKVILK